MIISFEDLLILDDFDINEYPNKIVEDNYNNFKNLLNQYNLNPNRISLLPNGGVCFIFKNSNIVIYFEIYNDGEMGYIVEDIMDYKIIDNKDILDLQVFIKILNSYLLLGFNTIL